MTLIIRINLDKLKSDLSVIHALRELTDNLEQWRRARKLRIRSLHQAPIYITNPDPRATSSPVIEVGTYEVSSEVLK